MHTIEKIMLAEEAATDALVEAFLHQGKSERLFRLGNFVLMTAIATDYTGLVLHDEVSAAIQKSDMPEWLGSAIADVPSTNWEYRYFFSLTYFEKVSKARRKDYGLAERHVKNNRTGRLMYRAELNESVFVSKHVSLKQSPDSTSPTE